MGLISNRVRRGSLRPGDHIYSWRACHIYAHHGIYVGDNKVIHYTLQDREPGTGTPLDRMIASSISLSSCSHVPRPAGRRVPVGGGNGVVRGECLDCFLKGGKLYRYEDSVNVVFFLAKMRGGTCTRAVSDEDDVVVHRANYLLHNGFGSYNLFRNNCENFAVSCKTGLLVLEQLTMGQSGQMVGAVVAPYAVGIAILLGLPAVIGLPSPGLPAGGMPPEFVAELLFLRMISIYAIPAGALFLYCLLRLNADIGTRMDVVKVSVKEFGSMGVAMNLGFRFEYWEIIIIT